MPAFRSGAVLFVLAAGAALSWPADAQDRAPGNAIEQWGFDPSVLVADGTELLARAPDAAVDELFQAVHAGSRDPADAAVMCALFDPAADRSLAGLDAAASRLSPASQERFAGAVAGLLVGALQSPPRERDPAVARRALKQAGVRAGMLNDGFTAGLSGGDHEARCDSVAMLLDSLHGQPLAERAAVTRLLLVEGLARLANGAAPNAAEPARSP